MHQIFKSTIVALLLLFIFVINVQAANQQHMFIGSSKADVYFGNFDFDAYDPVISGSLGYSYDLQVMNTQLSFSASTLITDGPDFHTLMAGPTINFSKNYNSAFFFGVQAGISNSTYYSANAKKFIYSADLGKRFALADNISWNPAFSMLHIPSGDADPDYSLNLFSFSLFF